MKNFDPRWKDVPDYILGITKEIWEDRHIDSLLTHYASDLIVRSPASIVKGNTGIISATMATLAEFPDRELSGEDVIWCGAPDDGFLSSHRLICSATDTHPGAYGAPTGRKLTYRILADCYCAANAVRDEWLVRDQGAIVTQMGWDILDWTRQQIEREGGPEACVKPFTPERDIEGPYSGSGNDNNWGAKLADVLTRMMHAEFSAIPDQYDRAAMLHYPNDQIGHGWSDADTFWLGLRAAFPGADFVVDHVMGAETEAMPPRAAVRWSLNGRHDGWGRFGAPTGSHVHVMGITHAEFGPWGLRREWTLIDETAIWRQILLQTGNI